MNASTGNLEDEAYTAFFSWWKEAARIGAIYQQLGHDYPPALSRALGLTEVSVAKVDSVALSTPPPLQRPAAPPECSEDWIWVSVSDLYTTGLIQGLLREAGGCMDYKPLLELVNRWRQLGGPALHNRLSKMLTEGQLVRSGTGWKLRKLSAAPLLHEGNAWGLPSIFNVQEMASFRRQMIRHVVAHASDGLRLFEIATQLKAMNCPAPINKEAVKFDCAKMLEDGVFKRNDATKRFALAK